jgi:hypothetical protein
VGAHRQVIFTGFGVDTIALFSETLADGDKDDGHQRLISGSRCLGLRHCSQEVLSAHPLKIAKKKKTPMPARDQPLAPKKQTALETRKPKGRKKE